MLKLHCKRCDKLIKEINPVEASKLKGDEICTECRDLARETLDKLNNEYKKFSGELGKKYNDAVIKLEEAIHSYFK